MKKITTFKKAFTLPLIAGILAMLLVMAVFTVGSALAAPSPQEDDPDTHDGVKDCAECHLDVTEIWSHSPHAHAFDDPVFQDQWTGMEKPGECLACHTTGYQESTGEYEQEGIVCESCHGQASEGHPPEPVSILADEEYCGSCHTTTLSEWRVTGHFSADVGCMDCHDPHSQERLFKDSDEMCLNCHKEEDMGDYLNNLHGQNDIGCVDCHALVIPPDVIPNDGIVPTGHAFNITPASCVACHTDSLHAGFSLPGYENGAAAYVEENGLGVEETADEEEPVTEREEELPPEQRLQALETALASRNMTMLFQGGVIGLVFGGTTAWIVARNIRRLPEDEENDDDEEA